MLMPCWSAAAAAAAEEAAKQQQAIVSLNLWKLAEILRQWNSRKKTTFGIFWATIFAMAKWPARAIAQRLNMGPAQAVFAVVVAICFRDVFAVDPPLRLICLWPAGMASSSSPHPVCQDKHEKVRAGAMKF